MTVEAQAPSEAELRAVLGPAAAVWAATLRALEAMFTPLEMQWRPSKAAFGRICLVRHKKRTLLYLTPDRGRVWMAVILGERAFRLAMASPIPAAIKKMFSEAKPYAEGRGIRFVVSSASEVSTVKKLAEIKTTPK